MKLTDPQQRALGSFLDDGSSDDHLVRMAGVARPSRVMGALVDKGLVAVRDWYDEDIGWVYVLTDAGREAFAALRRITNTTWTPVERAA